jgi:hypothetical protein
MTNLSGYYDKIFEDKYLKKTIPEKYPFYSVRKCVYFIKSDNLEDKHDCD